MVEETSQYQAMFEGASQYQITVPRMLKSEWKLESPQVHQPHWIEFNLIKPILLTDTNRNPMGKIFGKKLLTFKREIHINTTDSRILATWSATFRTFQIQGETNIKGFENINWVWKRSGWNSKLTLEDSENGQCIAEFKRKHFSLREVGDLLIYPKLHPDLNWFIVFSGCYSVRHMQGEERSRGGGS